MSPLGISNYANKSVIYGSIIQVINIILLYCLNYLNVYTICVVTIITELTILFLRIYFIKRKLKENKK